MWYGRAPANDISHRRSIYMVNTYYIESASIKARDRVHGTRRTTEHATNNEPRRTLRVDKRPRDGTE